MTEHSEIFNKAFENHKSGNFEVAQNLYMEILKSEPENAEVWDLLGVLNFQKNDFLEAERMVEELDLVCKKRFLFSRDCIILKI